MSVSCHNTTCTQVMCFMWCSVWDVRSHQIVKTLETTDVVLSLEIVNSNLFVTADGKSVKLWDANSFQVVKSFSFPHKVESASYSPEKHKLAAGGEDMWVHLSDFDSGEEVDCNKGETLLHASMLTVYRCRSAQSHSKLCWQCGPTWTNFHVHHELYDGQQRTLSATCML